MDEEGNPVPPTIKVLAPADEPARQCYNCDGFKRERTNHAWACRSHRARWAADSDYRGDGEPPGVWPCCGKTDPCETGCTFQACNLQGGGGDAA